MNLSEVRKVVTSENKNIESTRTGRRQTVERMVARKKTHSLELLYMYCRSVLRTPQIHALKFEHFLLVAKYPGKVFPRYHRPRVVPVPSLTSPRCYFACFPFQATFLFCIRSAGLNWHLIGHINRNSIESFRLFDTNIYFNERL